MKKQLVSVMATIIACTAFADVLLWQVPSSSISGTDVYGKTQTIGTGDYEWNYAMLRYVDSSTTLTVDTAGTAGQALAASYEGTSLGERVDSSFGGEDVYSTLPSGSKSYYIALYNSTNDKLVGYSQLVSGDSLSNFKALGEHIASWEGMNSWNGGSSGWTAAPEPTSGVLLLLGAAVLGLRRRKVA